MALEPQQVLGEADDRAHRNPLCTSVLIRTRNRAIVVDPSLQPAGMPSLLDRRPGLSIPEVDTVFLTHFHGDHRFGKDAFPEAEWLMAGEEVSASRDEPPENDDDRRVLDRLREAPGDLASLLAVAFGILLPKDASCEELRVSLARHVLSTEFARTISHPLPPELSSVYLAEEEPAAETCAAHTPYEPHHLDIMLEELQTDFIDTLVVHADDADGQRRKLELARDWMESGRVRCVALGMAKARHLDALPEGHPVCGVLTPFNVFARDAADAFIKAQGMERIALSPFVRGWKLDEIGEDPAEVSGILLRWVASQDLVDHVIVSMRKSEWVRANLDAVARGPLTEEEQIRLEGWLARVG
jgi:hypothetical protein